jgi:threonine/homoserine/homoserine lactone efflux protein
MFFLKSIIIGLSVAAPVGPIGLLCINRTLRYGWWSGLATGLGAATADVLYGTVAACGLTAVSRTLMGLHMWLGLLGGMFLIYLGIKTIMTERASHTTGALHNGLWKDYLSSVVLTITSPMTILTFVAVFAGLGLPIEGGPLTPVVFVCGVFMGSALWWITLSGTIAKLHHTLPSRAMVYINYLSGVIITGLGVWSIVGLV